jgi:hypothetical protein
VVYFCSALDNLPGWQAVYEELRDQNFEIITVAQDMLGEAATAEWHDQSALTYTTLIDTQHRVTSLYNLFNVPTGILVDEEGRVRRIDDGAYSGGRPLGSETIGAHDYSPVVRDWVLRGEESPLLWSREEMVDRIRRRTPDEARAEPTFKLGMYFYDSGDETLARRYWEQAQALSPAAWNFHRQDWNLTEGLAGPKWHEKMGALGRPFYDPLDLPTEPGR